MLSTITLLGAALGWLLLYALLRVAVQRFLSSAAGQRAVSNRKTRDTLIEQLPSYLMSSLHALFVTPRGVQHLLRLFRAPLLFKLLAPREGVLAVEPHEVGYEVEIARVMFTNLTLSSYLLADLVLVVREFPTLGGLDMLLHHAAFLFCGAVAGHFRLYPFTFGWLIVGEASTPLLNLRWFLIKIGLGHTFFFKVVQILFGLVFLITRFFIYGSGLLYHLLMLARMPSIIPRWAITSTTTLVCMGFVLNISWLGKIAKIAMSPPPPKTGGSNERSGASTRPEANAQEETTATASAAAASEHDKEA